MTFHRRPPRPPTWASPRGYCRLCGHRIEKGTGGFHWHARCAEQWKVAAFTSYARAIVFERDKGRCAECGIARAGAVRRWGSSYLSLDGYGWSPVTFEIVWELDHRHPLHRVPADAPWVERFWHWTLANMQTLCVPCHATKSAQEAKVRAKATRQRAKFGSARGLKTKSHARKVPLPF